MNKEEIIDYIRNNPGRYYREEAYELIQSGIFSKKELVEEYHVLTEKAYEHILKYPHVVDETDCLPLDERVKDFKPLKDDIEVLFWGVCGSGGKTFLLASLMSLVGKLPGFNFNGQKGASEEGYQYAMYLRDILKRNCRPPGTDTDYIQNCNTTLDIDGRQHKVSFIEFAGERVRDIAGNRLGDGICLFPRVCSVEDKECDIALNTLLRNKNKKIIFICHDPSMDIKCPCILNLPCEYGESYTTQEYFLSRIMSLMYCDEEFMKDVIGLHLIYTKSDVWLDRTDGDVGKSMDDKHLGGYRLIDDIQQLQDKYHIYKSGYQAVPIPFSVGEFMMGDTYEFDDTDARKIVDLIREDIKSYESSRSVWFKFKNFFKH